MKDIPFPLGLSLVLLLVLVGPLPLPEGPLPLPSVLSKTATKHPISRNISTDVNFILITERGRNLNFNCYIYC